MPGRLFAVAAALATALAITTGAGAAGFGGLNPGGLSDLREEVPVNVVFVGFGDEIDESAFLGELPGTYVPVVRSRLWYGVVQELGLGYTYDYNVVHADAAYEDALFGALAGLAEPAPLTLFQELYNISGGNVLDVEDNHFVDAPSVERWLIEHPPAGVDTTRNTVFFINWWGRDDFKFHVYTKIGEPDPDTGHDFGLLNESRKIVAWGGTAPADEETGYGGKPRRVWFYDVSAGPESWTFNYDVVDCETTECPEDFLPFDVPESEYRIPPSWEYDAAGYRDPALLSSDLGKLTRYVGVNLLFTTSPLYPPYLTPTKLPETINLDLNTYEGWTGTDASAQFQKPELLVSETTELIHNRTTSDNQDLRFQGTKAEECYVPWIVAGFFDPSCYPDKPNPPYGAGANMFLHHALNRADFLDGGGDYEAMAFNVAVTDDYPAPFLGVAEDNFVDGTQSFIYSLLSPTIVDIGYGLTTTQIHEYGHHWGLSHPHDGWDSETGVDYAPVGDFNFAWSGDESNSMMSYIDLNWDFSQFDQDNHNRHRAAGYMLNANVLAEQVLARPGALSAKVVLGVADGLCALGKLRLTQHDYEGTFRSAKRCYELARLAAQIAGVPVTASQNGWTVLDGGSAAGYQPSTKPQHGYSFDRYRTGLEKRFQP
jgi:hypothetical protein